MKYSVFPPKSIAVTSSGILLAAATFFTPSVWADPIGDTHVFRLGVYEQDIDVAAAITRDPFPEAEIDFDKVLGLEKDSTTYFFSYQWRFAEKWTLSAMYSDLEASGKKVGTKDFTWDGEEYTAGALLESEFDLSTLLVAADYSFIRDDRKEFGVGFGLHAFDIKTSIEATIGVAGVTGGDGRTNSDLVAPLPNLRGYGRYMINPKWAVMGSLGWLSFNYEDYDGQYLFVTAMTEYRFSEHFGMGLSYQVSEIDVEHESKRGSESFDFDLYGPSIYFTYGF